MDSKGATCQRLDVDIFAHLLTGDWGANNLERRTREERQFTWPEIRYWAVGLALVIGGAAAAIWGDDLPFAWAAQIASELGPGVFTAGILALLVEPFFRKEFARDAFLASFRYVLPEEFKEEVAKILAYNFVSQDHTWRVKVDKIDDDVVLLTTTFERRIRNRTSSEHARRGLYAIPEFNYSNGKAEIKECMIESESEQERSERFNVKTNGDWTEATTVDELKISPDETAKISGKAIQYRRTNDIAYETFIDPIVDPYY